MGTIWTLACVVLSCHCISAISLRKSDGVVCLSIAVYEDEAWVDALLKNAFQFSEPTTRIVLHLNSQSNYSEQTMAKWETDRLAVSPNRVSPAAFKGALLYAHMINAKHMDKRWGPGTGETPCSYWVYQASNQMWVRSGFEKHVRKTSFGMILPVKDGPGYCPKDNSFLLKLGSRKSTYGWGQTENSFYPMEIVRGFQREMEKYLELYQASGLSTILDTPCYLEEIALQSYVLNFHDYSDTELRKHRDNKLTWVNINYDVKKETDAVPMKEVQAIVERRKGWERFFAVKRVNRDLQHPTTKYILSLTA